MHSVFISYRRSDSAGFAGRLYDHLAEVFGPQNVFMDVDSISSGADFIEAISHTLDKCEVVLVLIGPQWLASADETGQRRLDDGADPVRLEIAKALEKGRLVIPVLFDGVMMPNRGVLPEPLKLLSGRHAVHITHQAFRKDVQGLISRLREGILDSKRDRTTSASWLIEAGVEVKLTRFRFTTFFSEGEEFILTGTNFGDQMGDIGTPPGLLHQLIVGALKRSPRTSVYVIIAPFELLEKMIPNSLGDLKGRSASRLKMLHDDPRLTPKERSRLHIFDHRGATFLSVALRDPDRPAERRGLAVVTTRWFKDEAGPQRMFFVLEEAAAPEVFKAFILPIYPSIKVEETTLALQPDRTQGGRNIGQICAELGVKDDPFTSELTSQPL